MNVLRNTFLLGYDAPVNKPPTKKSAIARLVEHHGGATALSRKLDDGPVAQEIERWLRRGWAAPKHIPRLQPHLPRGIRIEDLYLDRMHAVHNEVAAS